jgi:hypothetical protein
MKRLFDSLGPDGYLLALRAKPAGVEEVRRRVTRPSGNTTGPPLHGLKQARVA